MASGVIFVRKRATANRAIKEIEKNGGIIKMVTPFPFGINVIFCGNIPHEKACEIHKKYNHR
jgi:hypothetical protein